MIQPFPLISVSDHVAQCFAGLHACSNSALHHVASLVPDLSFCFEISSLSQRDVSEHLLTPMLVGLLNDAFKSGMM